MHFQLPRDFPSLLLALRDLYEAGRSITPHTVTVEVLAGDALSPKERAALEDAVSLALYELSVVPLLQSDHRGGVCPSCGKFTSFSSNVYQKQYLAREPYLTCPHCGQSTSRSSWVWSANYTLSSLSPEKFDNALGLARPSDFS